MVPNGSTLLVHRYQVAADGGPVIAQLDEFEVTLDELQHRGEVASGEEGNVEIHLSQGKRGVHVLGGQAGGLASIPTVDVFDNLADSCRRAAQHIDEEALDNSFGVLGAQHLPLDGVLDTHGDHRASEMSERSAADGLERLLATQRIVEVKSNGEVVKRLIKFHAVASNVASTVAAGVLTNGLAAVVGVARNCLAGVADCCDDFLDLVLRDIGNEYVEEFRELQ